MKQNRYIYTVLLVIFGVSFSQEIFEGYTLFTPQIGYGGEGATSYLIDITITLSNPGITAMVLQACLIL